MTLEMHTGRLAVALFVSLSGMCIRAQTVAPDYTSRVPKFTFGRTLAEQEEQLKAKPLMLRFAESLFRSRDLVEWEYLHPFVQGDRFSLAGAEGLGIEPAGDLASLRQGHVKVGATALPANQEVVLQGVAGSAMELSAESDAKRAQAVELLVLRSPGREEYTRIALYRERGYRSKPWSPGKERASVIVLDNTFASTQSDAASRMPDTAQVQFDKDEPFKLRVFIDRPGCVAHAEHL